MTFSEYARKAGLSRQALYNQLRAQGIDPANLRGADGQLSPEGLDVLASVCKPRRKPEGVPSLLGMTSDQQQEGKDAQPVEAPEDKPSLTGPDEGKLLHPADTDEGKLLHHTDQGEDKPSTRKDATEDRPGPTSPDADRPAARETAQGDLEQATAEEPAATGSDQAATIAELREQITELRHRAELAEVRAAASENERDFLRRELESAINAATIAGMQRLAPPANADSSDTIPAEPKASNKNAHSGPFWRFRAALDAFLGK